MVINVPHSNGDDCKTRLHRRQQIAVGGAGAAMVGYFQDVGFGIFCGNELLCRFFGVSFE